MQPSSWLLFCLSFWCVQGGNIPGSADKDQFTPTIEARSTKTTRAIRPTSSWDPAYFKEHGYSFWTEDNVFKVFTERYGHNSLDPVVHLYVDTEHEAVTIYEDNLLDESTSEDTLKIQNIYRALCLKAEIEPTRMQWIALDVDDPTTSIMLRDHRQNNGLSQDDFYITPGQNGWKTFSNNHYFQAAAKMIPGGEIDRIAVRTQQREVQVAGHPPIDVECIMFSFKQPFLRNDGFSMDPIDKNLLEIEIKNNLDAIVESAEHAIATTTKALLEAESSDETVTEA
ncbi:hypothetical protein CFIMG_008213RA00001 [Ceratocystis fimbriata CBS 114723]|uniref:Uncharacterized protein n=1 Tax=Ceratocystis fimbriata CBS 114723 TaxID=1035309 RepID=A0A2C5X598_9PEZI|nr:hypothetical protein CFIMG_008213RA00001 [Ceratocystis fimbriata CBS 114723]